jgi:hypothetical protein
LPEANKLPTNPSSYSENVNTRLRRASCYLCSKVSHKS